MSILRLYEDSDLAQIITLAGDFENPDEETSIDGTGGEVRVKELHVAIEQTKLDGGIDDEQETITTVAALFANESYKVLIIDSEELLITGGGGTKTPSVQRGYNGTTPASHADEAAVRLKYECESATIECVGEDAGMVKYRLSGVGSYVAQLSLGDINYDETVVIQRQVVVEEGSPAEDKRDLVHRLEFDLDPDPGS